MISQNIYKIKKIIGPKKLIIVSKKRSHDEILDAYNTGHRDFGENKVQELIKKYEKLPKDIKWHMIGHLQKNKVKYIIPFIHLIHSVDSIELLNKINTISEKEKKITNCLIQIKIAQEQSKFGMTKSNLEVIKNNMNKFPFVKIKGLMGMATASSSEKQIKNEFDYLNKIYLNSSNFKILCMGMSQDYKIANKCGSNMFRIGSYVFK
tara:strand:+ start:912 stop:1532 length:621 start_codon:yes stop_codon:yes gene_type:complete